ncbi:MAG TPA: hypothetical protein VKI41_16995 [Vicinamibacteria bacterium]|nr:hypothetical protein [Vicinamibacteria bacterium]
MKRRPVKRGQGQQQIERKDFNLADEIAYIQRQAADHVSRIVTLGPVLLFSTKSGDAWLLDPADHLATPIARDGEALPVSIVDAEKTFSVAWRGRYEITGDVFTFHDAESGRVTALLGYPTRPLIVQISNIFG